MDKINSYSLYPTFAYLLIHFLLTGVIIILSFSDYVSFSVIMKGLVCLAFVGFFLYTVIKWGKLYVYRLFVTIALVYFIVLHIPADETLRMQPALYKTWLRAARFISPFYYSVGAFAIDSIKQKTVFVIYLVLIILLTVFGHMLFGKKRTSEV